MKIVVNVQTMYSGDIVVDGVSHELFSFSTKHSLDWRNAATAMYAKLSRFLVVDGFNYSYLFNYFLEYSTDKFTVPGLDFILNYIGFLDRHVTGDVELEVTDPFGDVFFECCKLVCKRKGFKCRLTSANRSKSLSARIVSNQMASRAILHSWLFIRSALGLIRLPFKTRKRGDVLFLSNIRFSAKDETKNSLFGSLISALKQKHVAYKVVRYEQMNQLANLNRFVRHFLFSPVAYFGDYYSFSHYSWLRSEMRKFRLLWRKLSVDKDFTGIFSYRGYDLFPLIRPRLELIFGSLCIISMDARKITETILKKEKPRLVVIDHEENIYGKALMLNARLNPKVKTLALSHELIYPGCVHTHTEYPSSLDRKSPFWRPLPNLKCVWSEYSKEVLLEYCNYPPKIIKVTGNPKFDFVKSWKFSPPVGNRILFASQWTSGNLRAMLQIASSHPSFDVTVKPHPTQSLTLKNPPYNVSVVSRYSDIYRLIRSSDYVVTSASTVGIEAMLMGKVVFIINFKRSHLDGLPYLPEGAAIEICSKADFDKALGKLKDKKYLAELKARISRFVEHYHYKNDGFAAERIGKLIQQQLGK